MGAGRRFVRSARTAAIRSTIALGLAGCRDEPTKGTAPFVIEASLALPPTVTVGTRLSPGPTFVVLNVDGLPLANVPVSITMSAGHGTLANAPTRTGTVPTSVGDWTLDTLAGPNALTITAGSAPAVVLSLTGTPDAPARIESADTGRDALAGDVLQPPLLLRVVDRYGNAIQGVEVTLAVAEGGGEVSPASVKTNSLGLTDGVTWRLGRLGGTQRIVATAGALSASIGAGIRSAYTPLIRFVGSPPAAAVAAAFAEAANRVHAIVVGDVSEVPILNFDMSRCSMQGATVNETIDDVVIFATVSPIDGVGKILASAGPCVMRTQSRLPVIGVMRVDADDVEPLAVNGRLAAVILHEMLHVVGIGTLWRTRDLVVGAGTPDPRLNGFQAALACLAAGGAPWCGDLLVPLENTGGAGTAEAHWRESIFDREVMTGFVEADGDMPLSTMSVASLEDVGYQVNLFAADPYHIVVGGVAAPRLAPQLLPPWEVLTIPRFEVTAGGWVRPLP